MYIVRNATKNFKKLKRKCRPIKIEKNYAW